MIKEPTLGQNLQNPITLTKQICFSKILGMEVAHTFFKFLQVSLQIFFNFRSRSRFKTLTFTTFDIVHFFSFLFPTLFPFFSSLLHLINSYEITKDF
jgi:hypothetical protein